MSSFFGKLRGNTISSSPMISLSSPNRKDSKEPPSTPLEKLLHDAGPLRNDGSDKFFGMENFGNTCYCNSIIQCLYYSVPFREQVINYPKRSPPQTILKHAPSGRGLSTEVTVSSNGQNPASLGRGKPTTPAPIKYPALVGPLKLDDKESPDFKKKQAMLKGPVLPMISDNSAAYGMEETLFTSLKDIFEAIVANPSRIGVVSPTKFLEVLRKDNEMFRSSMHQDAHEFLNLLLNEVVTNVETNAKKLQVEKAKSEGDQALIEALATESLNTTGTRPQGNTGWVHELFEGTLTSETKCLTCENVSQRDEAFLDLSVDLDSHSSVTSCLRKFSEEEMLCERNKFHCDRCGGLQEAEKRMKIKRLPKVLALHLKRFKYTEDLQRLQKLFHRVVYPYHLRLFNTTDDAEDPDRLYELYAVVVHIGGGPYHGHYVSIIKTPDRGWLLFDDEMVEPVDKDYVRNFFGDQPGLACAYVLFYQETTLEAVKREQEADGLAAARRAVPIAKDRLVSPNRPNGRLYAAVSTPTTDVEPLPALAHAATAPPLTPTQPISPFPPLPLPKDAPLPPLPRPSPPRRVDIAPLPPQSKKERAKEEKDRKAAEKATDKAQRNAGLTRGLVLRHKEVDSKRSVDVRSALEARKLSPKVGSDARFSSISTNGTETVSLRMGPTASTTGAMPRSPGLGMTMGMGSGGGLTGLGLRTSMASSTGALDTVMEPGSESKEVERYMEQERESEKERKMEKAREAKQEEEGHPGEDRRQETMEIQVGEKEIREEKDRENQKESERQWEKEREQEQDQERGREKERPQELEVEKEKARAREREREREMEREKEKEKEKEKSSTISRFRQTSKSLSRRPKFLGGSGSSSVAKEDIPTPILLTHMLPVDAAAAVAAGDTEATKEARKIKFGLRKKGSGMLS